MTFPNDHCKSESSGFFLPVSSFVNQERDCLCCSSYEDKIRRSGKMVLNRETFFLEHSIQKVLAIQCLESLIMGCNLVICT